MGFIDDIRSRYDQPVSRPAAPAGESRPFTGEITPYGQAALDGERGILAATLEGDRNAQLNKSSLKLFRRALGGSFPDQLVAHEMRAAARSIGLDDVEITKTLESAWKGAQKHGALEEPEAAADQWLAGLTAAGTGVRNRTPDGERNLSPATPDTRFLDGGQFIFDVPDSIPAVWGHGQEVLWAEGEALMIVGPSGVGKTTLTGQLVRGLLGLQSEVLGQPVQQRPGKILYLAMDRPAQVRRSLHRHFAPADRDTVAQRLVVWQGPPPGDMAKNTAILRDLCQLAGASTVIVDSLKDAAIGLSDDAVGAGYNSARQLAIAAGVQVLELHHQVKRGANGGKPKTLADVYGSTWITGGAGSVVLLWGEPGDAVIEFLHLKQPSDTVGPFRLMHDHDRGETTIWGSADPIALVHAAPNGITARDYAEALFDTPTPTASQTERARRKLNNLASQGRIGIREVPGVQGVKPSKVYVRGGSTPRSTLPFSP